MIISQSSIQMSANRTYAEQHTRSESFTYWEGAAPGGNAGVPAPGGTRPDEATIVSLGDEAIAASQAGKSQKAEAAASRLLNFDLNISILKELVERLTGRPLRLIDPATLTGNGEDRTEANGNENGAVQQNEADVGVGWGLAYDAIETYHEKETTTFNANGKITTADGRAIDFSVDLTMDREFMSREEISIRAGDALKDPLVINFNGTAAQLSQTTFSFDLDADGKKDQISRLLSGSGFLALDKNNDNTVNNGSELFGPSTGNGFAELAEHDGDHNGWIDENDSIYSGLRIWTGDDAGKSLFALGEMGIGAILLDSVATPFSQTDSANTLLGQTRATGLFVKENGAVGTVQQLDLVV